ncbi:MAG: DUF305 domain-containing protein [Actinomycetota bacterium]|nr:DUF305 domain-containing protein [Actinomycetota bacterium]
MMSYVPRTFFAHKTGKRLAFLVVTAAFVFGAAACGGSNGSKASSSDFNTADVTFTQDMIAHHTQAIEMAKLAPGRATDAGVKDLAKRIQAAQDPEISRMKRWLKDWGKPVSSNSGMASNGGMADHGSGKGMMSEAEMGTLMATMGSKFHMMFLEMMTTHHMGAIDMAKAELADGKSADAKKLAQDIIDAQTKEIAEMKTLRKGV